MDGAGRTAITPKIPIKYFWPWHCTRKVRIEYCRPGHYTKNIPRGVISQRLHRFPRNMQINSERVICVMESESIVVLQCMVFPSLKVKLVAQAKLLKVTGRLLELYDKVLVVEYVPESSVDEEVAREGQQWKHPS